MKKANTYKGKLGWQSEFSHRYACWANNHNGWAKAKKSNKRLAKRRYCSSYYASLEQMVADYGFRGALQIMAECIFEQLGFDDMEFNAEQKSEGAAIKFIHEWMEG